MKDNDKKDTSFFKELVILFVSVVAFGEFVFINNLTIMHRKSVENWSVERKMLHSSISRIEFKSNSYQDSLKGCKSEAQKTLEYKIKKFIKTSEYEDK